MSIVAYAELSDLPVLTALADDTFSTEPARAFADAHAQPGPGIFRSPFDDGLVVTRHQTLADMMVMPAMGAQNRSTRKEGLGTEGIATRMLDNTPFFLDEPLHAPVAQAVYRPMGPSRIRWIADMVRATAEVLVDDLFARETVDLRRDYTLPIAARFWARLLGLSDEAAEQLRAWSTFLAGALQFVPTAETRAALESNVEALWTFLREHQRTLDETGSTLFHLLRADFDKIDVQGVELDAASTIASMTFDAIDGAGNMTANALYTLLRHPEQLSEVRADHALISGAWSEAARYRPSILGLYRSAIDDAVYEDIVIPRGTNVQMFWAAGNRDLDVFENPDVYDIHRGGGHLTFGGGTRMCKGRHVARIQGEIALQVLLEHSMEIELIDHAPDWGPPGMLHVIDQVPIRITPR